MIFLAELAFKSDRLLGIAKPLLVAKTSKISLDDRKKFSQSQKKSLNIAKTVEKRFELPTSTHDLPYEKSDWKPS